MEGPGQPFTEGEFYQAHFDPRQYLNAFYSCPEGNLKENCLKYELRQLSDTFASGKNGGYRLIEIGSGPSVHGLISACGCFEEIVMSDFTDRNREEVEKWLRAEDHCFDWDPIIKFVCELEGKRTLEEVKAKLRRSVKQVLKCDVRLENPFEPLFVEPADCVLTCLCLEAACKDLDTYRASLRSLKALLKPGGVLVMLGVLAETFYISGGHRLSCLPLSEDTVQEALRDLDLSIEKFNTLPFNNPNVVSDFSGFFHVVARKAS